MLWDAHVVEQWLANRNATALPGKLPPTKSEKQKAKAFEQRQVDAEAVLNRHRK